MTKRTEHIRRALLRGGPRWLALGACGACAAAMLLAVDASVRLVRVADRSGTLATAITALTEPGDLLDLTEVELGADDAAVLDLMEDEATLRVLRAFPVEIEADGGQVAVQIAQGTVADALKKGGVALAGDDFTEPALTALLLVLPMLATAVTAADDWTVSVRIVGLGEDIYNAEVSVAEGASAGDALAAVEGVEIVGLDSYITEVDGIAAGMFGGWERGKLSLDFARHFKTVAERLKKDGFLDPKVLSIDINTLLYQVPGGMLSNLINQLKQANASDKFYDVLAEIPRVREDFGYPPLVTPTSQIVGTRAVMNVLSGERYKLNPKESQGLMRGEYGRLPAPVNEEVRRKVIGDAKVITHRPADDIAPELEKYRKEIGQYITQEEDVLTYALFPQVATKFFEYRQAQQLKLDNSLLDKENHVLPV